MVGRPSSRLSLARLLVHCCSVTGLSLVCHWSVCSTHLSLMLGSACLCITDPSARLPLLCWSITGPSLVHHWSITGPSLVHHCSVCSSVAFLSFVCLLVRRWSVYWSRGHWPVAGLSARSSLVHLFGSWSLVCILDSWSLTCSSV